MCQVQSSRALCQKSFLSRDQVETGTLGVCKVLQIMRSGSAGPAPGHGEKFSNGCDYHISLDCRNQCVF
jgi:hypothetical protein